MTQQLIEIQTHEKIGDIGASAWDACACPETRDGGAPINPFTTYRFLHALEASGSVGPGTGWQPLYLTAAQNGEIIGCAPLYAKSHSQGEYVFDHSWAHAYEQSGGRYYPKLQIAVPFTPVTGRRFLCRPGTEASALPALVQGAIELAGRARLSSLHISFCSEEERLAGEELGLLGRQSQQYHWRNRGYTDFDGFLADLSSRKRKAVRKERARAAEFGGTIRTLTGDDITQTHWDAMWTFYQDTGARKWGTPYLTRRFFDIAHESCRDDVALVLAERDGTPIAGALNFIGRNALFGRYWGCVEEHPYLHFELCYHRAIDFAIERRLDTVEAGAQGDHKLARGYLPVSCHSLHWIADARFSDAVAQFLTAERAAVTEEIEVLTAFGPFRRSPREDQP